MQDKKVYEKLLGSINKLWFQIKISLYFSFRGISGSLGNPWKNPWVLKLFNPCLELSSTWNCYPCPCLEIQGFLRSRKYFPWIFWGTLNLENPRSVLKSLPLTLKTLEFREQHQGSSNFKATVTLSTLQVFSAPWLIPYFS